MLGIDLKRTLAIGSVAAVALATAGSASAVTYNGHAGLGASAYQHNQTDLEFLAFSPQTHAAGVTDGTSNTIMFAKQFSIDPGEGTAVIASIGTKYTMASALRVDPSKNEVAIETLEGVISGDAYDNEMGVRAAWLLPNIDDEVL